VFTRHRVDESLKEKALTMMSSVPAGNGLNAGPSFEYMPGNINSNDTRIFLKFFIAVFTCLAEESSL
jgi:hypothetical protein